tara:strand:+ start:22833 stop:24215 length:1383 start_codon:yes stop_codon:yes gene_type:complete
MATKQSRQNRADFIKAMKEAGLTSPVTREQVREVCDSTGIYAVPPSWITYDASRKTGALGEYHIPELSEGATTTAPAKEAAPMTATIVTNKVKTADVCDTTMALAMTGGESETLVPERISTYVPWGHFKDIEQIIRAKMFYPCFITGLSGNGKTTMVDQVCAKLKRELFRINITTQTDEDDLLGGFRLINGETKWCDGPVVKAMKQGGILLLDEIDLASHAIMCLQPVLEGKGVFLKKIGQWVKPAAGFQIFATANTKGKGSDDGRFIGTNVLNEAFLDRFSVCFEQAYAPKKVEQKILTKAMQSLDCEDKDFTKKLVDWADMIRKCFYEDAVDEIITTRRLVNVATAFSIFGDRAKAVEMAVTRFDDSTKEAFLTMYGKIDADTIVGEEEMEVVDYETAERFDIDVSFDDKDEAKRLGARWDVPKKQWYVEGDKYRKNPERWVRWNPVAVSTSSTPAPF